MDNPAFQNDNQVTVKPLKKHLTRTNSTLTPTTKSWHLTQMPRSKLCRCNSVVVPKNFCAEDTENHLDGPASLDYPFLTNNLPSKKIFSENSLWTKEFWSDSYNRLHSSSPVFQNFGSSKPGVSTIYDPHFLSSKFGYSGSHQTVSSKDRKEDWWPGRSVLSSHRVAVILCALILTLLASGNIMYILNTVSKPMESPSKSSWVDIVLINGEFKITNELYRLTLANHSSNDYLNLSSIITHQLDSLFSLSVVAENYHSTAVSELLPGLLVHCQVVLRPSPPLTATRVGLAFIGGLRNQHSHVWLGNFSVDIQSIGFQANLDAVSWSGWSEWGTCHQTQEFGYVQIRSRNCTLRSGQALYNTLPCLLVPNSLGNVETTPCLETLNAAESYQHPVKVLRQDCNKSQNEKESLITPVNASINIEETVKNVSVSEPCLCVSGEVCVALQEQLVPQCLPMLDQADPTGCGGHCKLSVQLCHKIQENAFRCIDDSKCLEDEWQCGNQLCIPQSKRCDGHFNCYDHTDEHDCDCNLTSHFQCGNRMSCLPLTKRCDAVVDCWDATDELNCTIHCVGEEQFTCNDSQCIPNQRFCDGFPDCNDHSDEPFGCGGECKTHEWKCRNSRCVPQRKRCDEIDDCGDNTDEVNCPLVKPGSV